jgi:MFS family permease
MADTATRPIEDAGREGGPAAQQPARRRKDFNWFWGAWTVSTIGDQVTLVALPFAVYARTHSALSVGIAASMQGATALVFGLFAGAMADRLRHRAVLIATDWIRAAALALLAVLVATSSAYPVMALYFGAFVLGALGILHDASHSAALPLVVRGRDLLRANGKLSASESIGNAAGPALAGALTAVGVGLAFVADALSFLLSAIGMTQVRTLARPPSEERSEQHSMTEDIREGLRALRSDRVVMNALILVTAGNVMAVAVEAQFIPYAREVLHLGALGVGLYFAIGGAAGVFTALALSRSDTTRGSGMIFGAAIFGLGVLAAGVFPSRITAVFTYLAAGAGSVLLITHWSSLRQRRFPVRLLGRVTVATRLALFGVMPIAYLAGGALARSEGSQALFVAAGGVGLAACAWAWVVGLGRVRLDDVVQER